VKKNVKLKFLPSSCKTQNKWQFTMSACNTSNASVQSTALVIKKH